MFRQTTLVARETKKTEDLDLASVIKAGKANRFISRGCKYICYRNSTLVCLELNSNLLSNSVPSPAFPVLVVGICLVSLRSQGVVLKSFFPFLTSTLICLKTLLRECSYISQIVSTYLFIIIYPTLILFAPFFFSWIVKNSGFSLFHSPVHYSLLSTRLYFLTSKCDQSLFCLNPSVSLIAFRMKLKFFVMT